MRRQAPRSYDDVSTTLEGVAAVPVGQQRRIADELIDGEELGEE